MRVCSSRVYTQERHSWIQGCVHLQFYHDDAKLFSNTVVYFNVHFHQQPFQSSCCPTFLPTGRLKFENVCQLTNIMVSNYNVNSSLYNYPIQDVNSIKAGVITRPRHLRADKKLGDHTEYEFLNFFWASEPCVLMKIQHVKQKKWGPQPWLNLRPTWRAF